MKVFRWFTLTAVMLLLGAAQATSQDAPVDSLQIEQFVSKASMNVRSCQGESDRTTVTVMLSSAADVVPLDIALVVDRSTSEDLGEVQDAAHRFLNYLNPDKGDRVSLVSFADTAQLEQPLTTDFVTVESQIDTLETGQLTALGDALSLALDELNNNKNAGSLAGIVVLSDGGATTGLDPLAQADRASDLALPIYFVGISESARRATLSELAQRAGGNFFASASDQSLVGVLKRFERSLIAEFITIDGTLPDAFSFAGTPDGVTAPGVVVNANNDTTALTWQLDTLISGQAWSTQFDVIAEQIGTFNLNRSSLLAYLDANGVRVEQALPNPQIAVTGTPLPVARFEMNPNLPKANQTTKFFDRSTASGTISSWAWDFGDGTTSSDQHPTHVYNQIGRYTVTLTVTDNNNCAVTFERTFRISEVVPGEVAPPPPRTDNGTTGGSDGSGEVGEPAIQLPDNAIRTGQAETFGLTLSDNVAACRWEFGDGGTSDECAPTYTYTQDGTFTITLTLTFEDGSTRVLTQQITVLLVNQLPVASFVISPFNPRVGQTVGFDSSASSDPDGTIASYSWDFGDGTTSTQANPVHEFDSPGRKTVSLTVTDSDGATHTVTQNMPVGLPRGGALGNFGQNLTGPDIPDWMEFYIDGGIVTDEELEDASRRFANGSFVQSTQYRLTADDLRAITDIHDLRVLTAKYFRPDAAIADGYSKEGPFRPGIGQAYINETILNADEPPRFDNVPILLYAPDGEGNEVLVGVSFVAFEQDHANLFGITDWVSFNRPPPPGAPGNAGPGPSGVPTTIYFLNVWVWLENPNGMFTPFNPAVE